MDTSLSLMTAPQHERLTAELAELYRIRARDLLELLRDAEAFAGAEEIEQLREDFAVVDARIHELEQRLRGARILRGGWSA